MTGQSPQTFAELAGNGSIGGWIFGRRDGSASSTTPAKQVSTPPTGLDPEPLRITMPPRTATHSPAVQFAHAPHEDPGPKSTKYTTAERRKAISEALKRRRASGANDRSHGQHKRVQTGNFQSSLLSFLPQTDLSAQHQSHPFEPVSASSTLTSAPTSESSDVEMMDDLAPILAPENIHDDSDDGDWEEGSQGSGASVANLLDSQLQAGTTGAADIVPRAFENTPSGRPYLSWKNERMYGTIIPDGYEWSSARSGFPWICPVRSCRKLFTTVKPLGGHFVRQHRGSLLHDNMDGTLSIRGTYAKLRDGEGSNGRPKPGIVISVGPLDPSEPPMVAPSLPEQGRHGVDNNQSHLAAGSKDSAAQSPALSPVKTTSGHAVPAVGKASPFTPPAGDGFELAEPGRKYTEWLDENGNPRSLCGALIPAGYTMCLGPGQKPFHCPVRNCEMECIRTKDLGFHFARGHYASYLKDNGDGTFNVVGAYAPKRGNIARSGKILNPGPPIIVAQTRLDGKIEWLPNWDNMKRLSNEDGAAAAAAPAIDDTASDVPVSEEAPVSSVSDSTPKEPWGLSRLPEKTWDWPPKSTWEQTEAPPRPQVTMANEKRDVIMEDVEEREGSSTRYQMRTRTTAPEYVYEQPVEAQPRQPPNSLVSKGGASNGVMATGLVTAESVFEMEDWEVAPGRIREQDPSSESIAFSKSYLSSAHAVDICEDIAFRVDTIQSGHNFRIEADSNQMRLCSLASGKLRVKIGDEPEFVIGPHGMFKVKAGVSCMVTNRMYVDAIMHTTVLNGFV